MGEGRTEGAQPDESPKEYVTVGEAAKLLGIHRNTVHNRIKVGRITAHKVVEGECEVYRIYRAGSVSYTHLTLPTNREV